jgi:hypothetical protein
MVPQTSSTCHRLLRASLAVSPKREVSQRKGIRELSIPSYEQLVFARRSSHQLSEQARAIASPADLNSVMTRTEKVQ